MKIMILIWTEKIENEIVEKEETTESIIDSIDSQQ